LIYDAVRVRLVEIGEAVKGIDPDLLRDAPGVPWKEIARMRDHLAHRYFDTDHAIVQDIVDPGGRGVSCFCVRKQEISAIASALAPEGR
jgi:uncharacterized protein with HEPN domain